MRERERKDTPARDVDMRGNIPPEVDEWMRDRADAFRRATQRKGMPMTYGTGDRGKDK